MIGARMVKRGVGRSMPGRATEIWRTRSLMNCWKSTSDQARALVEMAVQDRQRQHPVLRVAEEFPVMRGERIPRRPAGSGGSRSSAGCSSPDRWISRKACGRAVRGHGLQLLLAAGDRRRHLAHPRADRRHLGRPGIGRHEAQSPSPRDAAGEFLDVAQRSHAPAIGAQPDREQHDQRCQQCDGRELAPNRAVARRRCGSNGIARRPPVSVPSAGEAGC